MAAYVFYGLLWTILPGTGLNRGKYPWWSASRCIGITHASIVIPLSAVAIMYRISPEAWRELDYLAVNTFLEMRIGEISMGYFAMDTIHLFISEWDTVFFFHHLISFSVFLLSGILGRCGTCITCPLFIGEITNPLQSSWTLARFAKSKCLLTFLSPVFTITFTAIRVGFIPFLYYYIFQCADVGSSVNYVPVFMTYVVKLLGFFMLVGGFLWSYLLIKGLIKFYSPSKAAPIMPSVEKAAKPVQQKAAAPAPSSASKPKESPSKQ